MKQIVIRYATACGDYLRFEDENGKLISHTTMEEPTDIVKALELLFTHIGYKPDIPNMYIDDSLIVLTLNK